MTLLFNCAAGLDLDLERAEIVFLPDDFRLAEASALALALKRSSCLCKARHRNFS